MQSFHWNAQSVLPMKFVWGTCHIFFTRIWLGAEDEFQAVLVPHAAARVVESCLTVGREFRGGWARLPGGDGDFVVFVGGG